MNVPRRRLDLFRMLVGGYSVVWVLLRVPQLRGLESLPPSSFRPTGLVDRLVDEAVSGTTLAVLIVATLISGVLFTVGWRFAVTGPAHAVLLLWLLAYGNSFGQVFHTENLLVLHTIVLAAAPVTGSHAAMVRGWPLRLAAAVTVTTYVMAGATKLRNAGVGWLDGENLRNYVAYDNLRKAELDDIYSPVGGWLVGHAWFWGPIAVLTLVVEIGAVLALLGRQPARVWAFGAWLFHVGVLAVMAIFFPYQLFGLAFAPFFALEQIETTIRARLGLGHRGTHVPSPARSGSDAAR